MKNRHVSVSELTRVSFKLTRVGYLSDTLPSGVYSLLREVKSEEFATATANVVSF